MGEWVQVIISHVVALGVGGFITWLVTKCYYEKASNELKSEAERLRVATSDVERFVVRVCRALEEGEIAKFNWKDGKPVGLVFDEAGKTITTTVEVEGTDTLVKGKSEES